MMYSAARHKEQVQALNTAIMRENFEDEYIAEDNPPAGISKPRWSAMLKHHKRHIDYTS
jgi:hypothetical protein